MQRTKNESQNNLVPNQSCIISISSPRTHLGKDTLFSNIGTKEFQGRFFFFFFSRRKVTSLGTPKI